MTHSQAGIDEPRKWPPLAGSLEGLTGRQKMVLYV